MLTGASSGIGEATALAVAAEGGEVLLVARREAELRRVRRSVESIGGRATTYVCDLTDFDAVDALVVQVLAEHGGVDYLVNNAGRSIRRSLALSYDRFHDVERTMAAQLLRPGAADASACCRACGRNGSGTWSTSVPGACR